MSRTGWTYAVYFPPQANRAAVDAITDQLTAIVYDMPREGWDPFAVLTIGDRLDIDGADT